MTKLIEQVEELKAELKNKFLDYYQANQNWLKKMEGMGQRVDNTWFILGVVTALEPKSELKELLQYFLMVSQDFATIARALGLNFEPEKELEKRQTELAVKETKTVTQYLDQIREEIKT